MFNLILISKNSQTYLLTISRSLQKNLSTPTYIMTDHQIFVLIYTTNFKVKWCMNHYILTMNIYNFSPRCCYIVMVELVHRRSQYSYNFTLITLPLCQPRKSIHIIQFLLSGENVRQIMHEGMSPGILLQLQQYA